MDYTSSAPVTLVTTDSSWIDPLAIDQLHASAHFEGMRRVVGLPDLHAGNGIAVGAAFWAQNRIWPHLVGSEENSGASIQNRFWPLPSGSGCRPGNDWIVSQSWLHEFFETRHDFSKFFRC